MLSRSTSLLSQIYDPRETTTTKPPERRESVLPWHRLIDERNASRIQTGPRFSQSQQPQNKSGGKGWSVWRKPGNSEIEQRTQIDIPVYVPEQASKKIPDQERDAEFDKFGRQHIKLPAECDESMSDESDENRRPFKDESKYGKCGQPQNEVDFEHEQPSRTEKETQYENDNLYEGVAIDSTVNFAKLFK